MPVFRNKLTSEAAHTESLSTPSQTFCFAPNVTPTTYPLEQSDSWHDDDDLDESTSPDASEPSPFESFFTPALPKPNTDPHTRRMSEDHIPRPPNAFILFRSDLVHRKAVPSSIESDHGSISKIIGHCWRTLPPRQKKIWEKKAAEAKAAHKAMYPNYRYSPVHRKDGAPKRKVKKEVMKDERRCEDVARLLMSGAKGEELESKVRELDAKRPPAPPRQDHNMMMPPPGARMYRRSSSAPLPGATFDGYEPSSPILLPTLPPPSLPSSPGNRILRLPHRNSHVRSSSANPSSRRRSNIPKDQVARSYYIDQSYDPAVVSPSNFEGFQDYRFPDYETKPLPVGSSFEYFDPSDASLFPSAPLCPSPFSFPASPSMLSPSPLSAISSSLHNWSGSEGSQSPSPFQQHPHYPPSSLLYSNDSHLSEQLAHFELSSGDNASNSDAPNSGASNNGLSSCGTSTAASSTSNLSSPHWDSMTTPTQNEGCERQQAQVMQDMYAGRGAFGLELQGPYAMMNDQSQQMDAQPQQQLDSIHQESFTASLFQSGFSPHSETAFQPHPEAGGFQSHSEAGFHPTNPGNEAYNAGLIHMDTAFQLHDLIQPHVGY